MFSFVSHGQSGWSCNRSKVKCAPRFLRLGPGPRDSNYQRHILSTKGSATPGSLMQNWHVATFSKDLTVLMDHMCYPAKAKTAEYEGEKNRPFL